MNYLEQAAKAGATDLHLCEDGEVFMRCLGRMQRIGTCSKEDYQQIENSLSIGNSILVKDFEKVKDFSVSLPELGRIRGRCYLSLGKRCMAIRFLPQNIPTPQMLGWPMAMYSLCQLNQGLVLVTGATGSGKTTTLAAVIELINQNRPCHIVTLESPIEYAFESKQALIHQCAVPEDMDSFSQGAISVLRMDPDVIMIGELVDCETMRAVLKLAESGHLVFATMHTASVVDAIEYFINHFEASDQQVIRHQLANVLKAVVAQRLLVDQTESSLIAVYEIMLRNSAMVQQLKSNDLSQLVHTIDAGRKEGMCLLEEGLAQLVKQGVVRIEEALRAANAPTRLRKYLEG